MGNLKCQKKYLTHQERAKKEAQKKETVPAQGGEKRQTSSPSPDIEVQVTLPPVPTANTKKKNKKFQNIIRKAKRRHPGQNKNSPHYKERRQIKHGLMRET